MAALALSWTPASMQCSCVLPGLPGSSLPHISDPATEALHRLSRKRASRIHRDRSWTLQQLSALPHPGEAGRHAPSHLTSRAATLRWPKSKTDTHTLGSELPRGAAVVAATRMFWRCIPSFPLCFDSDARMPRSVPAYTDPPRFIENCTLMTTPMFSLIQSVLGRGGGVMGGGAGCRICG